MVEFALCIPVFLIFIYGLTAAFTWGTAGIVAQDVANETARKYAITLDTAKSKEMGETYLGRWAFIFVDPDKTTVNVKRQGTKAVSTVTVRPRITKFFVFEKQWIKRRSSCTLEYVWRNRSLFNY